MRLNIIIASTRPGRVGLPVGRWFHQVAKDEGSFDVHLVDLEDVGLPMLDEPKHPRLKQYAHEHTKRWSEIVDAGDAFVFVTPEYNFGPTPALVNALSYVYSEWNYKPAAFVSYGGISGGIRAVQLTKPILLTLKMVPILEQVMIPMVAQHIQEDAFQADDVHLESAQMMLPELKRWAEALAPMRGSSA